jgi:hypothetical protein
MDWYYVLRRGVSGVAVRTLPVTPATFGGRNLLIMKSSEQRLQAIERKGAEEIVENHVAALFGRLPMLCGFVLAHDLEVAEVTVHTWPGYTAGEDLYEELMQALVDLAEERPDAALLMRGRTFARIVH